MDKTKTSATISTQDFLSRSISFYLDRGFSVALWKLPGSSRLNLAASDNLQHWSEVNLEEAPPGFLFAPFHPHKKKLFLPADEHFCIESDQVIDATGKFADDLLATKESDAARSSQLKYHTLSFKHNFPAEKDAFLQLVNESRNGVLEGRFEKVVPSRSKTIPLPQNFFLVDTFLQVCRQYPHAMVSMFSSPVTGTWVGATPELLVSVGKDQHFRTVAVAGTQPFTEGMDLRAVTWTQKDIEEQALVERYIISCLKKIRLREFDEYGPKTVVAGNLLHLKTEFDVDMVATNFLQLGSVMLRLLHPTSAVCGMPMEDCLRFLLENEGYDREFYSGCLGPINVHEESHIYVNLRCMQLFSHHATLYAGAGVMADSDPEKEWSETEMKMNTLLKIIQQ